jgi:hypothetical protein
MNRESVESIGGFTACVREPAARGLLSADTEKAAAGQAHRLIDPGSARNSDFFKRGLAPA